MNVNYAKNFIKEYDIKNIDANSLEIIISKLGYNLVVYNPLFDYDDNVAAIIEGFNIEDELKNTCCFTCKSELTKYIFVCDGIEEKELIHLLLHEICHIYMHHVNNNPTEKSAYYEYEANKFAENVKHYVNRSRIKRKVLNTFSSGLLLALVIGVATLNLKNNESYPQNQETSNEITEPITESTTETVTKITVTEITTTATVTEPITESATEESTEPIAKHNEDDEMLYYVSASGTKYHTKDCYHINPEKCTALPLNQILEMGYTPCRTCEPDKRN